MSTQIENVIALIEANITANGNNEVTGTVLQSVLKTIANFAESTRSRDWLDSVKSIVGVPAGSPADGDRYLVNGTTSGAFVGKKGQIAEWVGAAWKFTLPNNQSSVRVDATGAVYRHDGAYVADTFGWVLDTATTGIVIGGADSDRVALACATHAEAALASGIAGSPLPNSYIQVQINGQDWPVQDGGDYNAAKCYFAPAEDPTGIKSWSGESGEPIVAGDMLYWNADIAGVALDAGWRVSILYLKAV